MNATFGKHLPAGTPSITALPQLLLGAEECKYVIVCNNITIDTESPFKQVVLIVLFSLQRRLCPPALCC